MKRDVVFLFLGAAMGIPTGMFSNYIYDWLFPQSAAVVHQIGVQGLSSPQEFFYFLAGSPDNKPQDGFITVNYASGTDTTKYKCDVTATPSGLFEYYRFEKNCRQVTFRFKSPELLWRDWNGRNESAAFSIIITSDKGEVWEGSHGVGYAIFKD